MVVSQKNVEKIVVINDQTKIAKHRNAATTTDIQVGDFIVVIGEPNDSGQVIAKLIRLMPPPPYEKN